jgi:hypothetical protein
VRRNDAANAASRVNDFFIAVPLRALHASTRALFADSLKSVVKNQG